MVNTEDPDKKSSSGIQAHWEPCTSAGLTHDFLSASNAAAAAVCYLRRSITVFFTLIVLNTDTCFFLFALQN